MCLLDMLVSLDLLILLFIIIVIIFNRRDGDIAVCYADTKKAANLLGWKAKRNLDDMCTDLWQWQSNNPNGFAK